jgi:hypothetical protein
VSWLVPSNQGLSKMLLAAAASLLLGVVLLGRERRPRETHSTHSSNERRST